MYRMFTAAGLLAITGLAVADGPADWKLYAFTAMKKPEVLFYLNSEMVRTPPDHVQVWMKALNYGKLDKATNALRPKDIAFKNAVEKTAHYYAPPYETVKKLSTDQRVSIVMFEELANDASISPTMRILYEIDCGQKLMRTLSIVGTEPGLSKNRVGDWEHVPPESTLETLSKLTCPHG